jgi:hypothetical protein
LELVPIVSFLAFAGATKSRSVSGISSMDISNLILNADLGHEREDAQIDTCAAFGAALFDVLKSNGEAPSLYTVTHRDENPDWAWCHVVVRVGDTYYDSLGEFSDDIIRKRLGIEENEDYELIYEPDRREGCYDQLDFQLVYEFLLIELTIAANRLSKEEVMSLAM